MHDGGSRAPEPDRPNARTRAVDRLKNASGVLPRLAESRLRHREGERVLRDELADVLAEGAVEAGFQPIVELATQRVVGWEALARGPRGAAWSVPTSCSPRPARRPARGADSLCQRAALRPRSTPACAPRACCS